MGKTYPHFVTHIYRDELSSPSLHRLIGDLEQSAAAICEGDTAGQSWCQANGYPGYTSHASLNDLTSRDPMFADLGKILDAHVAAFTKDLELDLGGRPLVLDSIWTNVLDPGSFHTAHIHPHSVISGTLYLIVPKGAGAIKIRGPAPGADDGRPAEKAQGFSERPHICFNRAKARDTAPVGEFPAP
jgi:uncharacterized protein (TIGR02466 family)